MKATSILAMAAAIFGGMVHETKPQPKADPQPKAKPEPKPVIPKGCKEFIFPDGFKTIALNEKSAQRKWKNHLESVTA